MSKQISICRSHFGCIIFIRKQSMDAPHPARFLFVSMSASGRCGIVCRRNRNFAHERKSPPPDAIPRLRTLQGKHSCAGGHAQSGHSPNAGEDAGGVPRENARSASPPQGVRGEMHREVRGNAQKYATLTGRIADFMHREDFFQASPCMNTGRTCRTRLNSPKPGRLNPGTRGTSASGSRSA